MIYINTTGKQNQVWLPKPYDIVIDDCPEAQDAWNSGYTSGNTDGYADGWETGYTSGYTDGKNSCSGGSCEEAWEEGYDSGYTDGVASVDCTEFYNSGKTDGIAEQKAKLMSTAITVNGTYTREDGYNSISVNVPSDSGTGYDSGYTDGWAAGYPSGYTDGAASVDCTDFYNSGYTSGKTDGVAEQKSKLVATAITSNGTYTREDGFNSINVNVPSDSGTGYNSGYTDGYQSGVTDGYDSGITFQKAQLSAITITENGEYQREDGYSAISVNVPVTAYTDLDLIANLQGDYFVIPSGTTHLRDYALYRICSSSITIPDSVTYIGSYALSYNDCLTNLTIPGSVTGTGGFAFANDTSLRNVNIGEGVLSFGSNAFQGCSSLTGVTFPTSITSIGSNCFTACTSMSQMTFNGLIPPTINIYSSLGYPRFPIYVPCESLEAYKTAFGSEYEPWIECYSGQTELDYLTIEAISGGTLYWHANNSSFTRTIEWSKDDGETWYSTTSSPGNSGTVVTNVAAGDKVLLKGDNSAYCDTEHINNFLTDFEFNLSGNVMSLINSVNFTTLATFTEPHALCSLFYDCKKLISARNLLLRATGLTDNCYEAMFYNCEKLTDVPVLPATVLASECYMGMFALCKSITTAPALPATTLQPGCYSNMFYGCTRLTTAPTLPATTLAERCYMSMFNGCTTLNYINCLATDITANSCTYYWVGNVTASGTFIKDPSMTSWTTGPSGIPSNWDVQDAS